MSALVIAALLGAAPAADAPWGLVNLTLDGGAWSADGRTSKNGAGTAAMTFFSPRIADDGTPYSLQPYLQRLSTVNVSATFSGFSTSDPSWPNSFSGADFLLGGAVNQYLTDTFAFTATGSIERLGESGPFDSSPPLTYVLPVISAGPAVRLGDTRVDLFYRYAPVIKSGNYDSQGRVYLNAQTVVEKQLSLDLQTHTLPSGASIHGGFGAYFNQRLQGGAGFTYARGQVYFDSTFVHQQLTPSADFSYWFTPLVRGSLTYSLVHTSSDATLVRTTDEHRLSLSFGTRLN